MGLLGGLTGEDDAVQGRAVVYGVVYSLGATRCIILHLATSQSMAHAFAGGRLPLPLCGAVIAAAALALVQVGLPHTLQTPYIKSSANPHSFEHVRGLGARVCEREGGDREEKRGWPSS